MDLLEDFQCLETVPGDDDLVSFFRQNCGGELRNFRFIIDDQDQFARALRIQDRNFRCNPSGLSLRSILRHRPALPRVPMRWPSGR